MEKLIIEAALNELVTRDHHPLVPLTPEEVAREAVDCFNAGASIVHFHPRDAGTGANRQENTEFYLDALRRIGAECDLIFYPTYNGRATIDSDWAFLKNLAADPVTPLEMHLFFTGASNHGRWDPEKKSYFQDAIGYIHYHEAESFLRWCQETGVKPHVGVSEHGHLRQALRYFSQGLIKPPLTCNFLSSQEMFSGSPPGAEGLVGLLRLVPPDVPFHWFVQNFGPENLRMNALAVAMGGHARTGVGDTMEVPKAMLVPESSARMVERVVSIARALGREVATPAEARRILGIGRRGRLAG